MPGGGRLTITTGHAEAQTLATAAALEHACLLPEPFAPAGLLRAVASMLEEAAGSTPSSRRPADDRKETSGR